MELILDLPAIISGKKIAYLEPCEVIWPKESGRSYELCELRGTNNLKPLHGIAGFNSQHSQYNKTLFRFPLRKSSSALSENLYTVKKVAELINALKSEAKYLLLFLRSIHTIEVYNIDQYGKHTLSFQTKIASEFLDDVKKKRAHLLTELKSRHNTEKYNLSKEIEFTAKFDVCVYDANTRQTSRSHWLVANQVGSTNATVRVASVKQKVFPWVGTAVELDNPGNGRIFCFLPMPIETASNLPVHVNGTFGLNDDRRNLKWPGVERRNDDTADWNSLLVHDVIPFCYVKLLLEAKCHFNSTDFYKVWPNESSLHETKWEPLLKQVFSSLLTQKVIFSLPYKQPGEWVTPSMAVFEPRELDSVVKRVLTACGDKLTEMPRAVREAFTLVGMPIIEASAQLTRKHIRRVPASYSSINPKDKHQLLKYCLSDGKYNDLAGLQLLPLCDGSFSAFSSSSSRVYLCTQECPRSLLPNMDHKLVELLQNSGLHDVLTMVARSKDTRLRELTVPDVVTLIDQSMPAEWGRLDTVPFPNTSNFPSDWFRKFWSWVQNKQLRIFKDKFVLPVRVASPGSFDVVKLTTRPVLYIPKQIKCSDLELSVLRKFGVYCCPQKEFGFVAHKELRNFSDTFDSNGIIKAISCSPAYGDVALTADEASCLRNLLCDVSSSVASEFHHVLCNLKIFSSAINTKCQAYSIKEVCHQSLLNTPITLATSNNLFDVSILPSNIIIFSSEEHQQKQLLKMVKRESFLEMVTFLIKHIFPRIGNWTIPDKHVDGIMLEALKMFDVLKYNDDSIPNILQKLPFVMTSSGVRKCPKDLYDPDVTELCKIFYDKPLFPDPPYDKPQHVKAFRMCGLRSSASPQDILDAIKSFDEPFPGTSKKQVDERKFVCAKAILKYIGTSEFKKQSHLGSPPFATSLNKISSSRCWLPILSDRPANYPPQLPWKGEGFLHHLCSLVSDLSISSASKTSTPLMYGSQLFFTDPVIDNDILASQEAPRHLVAHLQIVIDRINGFSPKGSGMFNSVQVIYSAMQDAIQRGKGAELSSLNSLDNWIYMKDHHKFISPARVALSLNPHFRHDLEPYLYKLPDSLSNYSDLFTEFGVSKVISEAQIISTLSAMKEDIERDVDSMPISAQESWNVVMAILNWLTSDGTADFSGSSDSVHVPVQADSEWPNLQAASEVVYTDNDFFKKFTQDTETEKPLQFIHSRVSTKIAECLGLKTLSKELGVTEDMFEDTGQYEPLTTRLKNILRDYKDGLTIIKELIQNADDAEATEINICFDARTHCTDTNMLFFPKMSEAHGPALVVHNNKMFSDEDFENITKLAAGTKQGKRLKIGKFGIGFCSVYHITDVPSFLSRNKLFIFDPTLKHLGKEVKNPARPGKSLQFTSRIIQNSRQLDPYDNLYEFSRKESYNGTMFRLPFRTAPSELSGKCYTEVSALELLEDLHRSSENLIMFLQHVKTISYQRISNREQQPTTLFTVRKENSPLTQTLSLQGISTISIDSSRASGTGDSMLTRAAASRARGTGDSKTRGSKWLVSQHSIDNANKYSVSSVACELHSDPISGKYSVKNTLSGEIFCYLPLSQFTGLPVHVSCNFAVINNRRGIWTAEESSANSSNETEVEWNIFLMDEVIPTAYMGLLNALKAMSDQNLLHKYIFYDLWPLSSELKQQNPWSRCVSRLYAELTSSQLFFSESQKQWKTMSEGRFLQPNILCSAGTEQCVLDTLMHLNMPIVDLPVEYRVHLDLNDSLIDLLGFVKIFFHNLPDLCGIIESRNSVMQLMLEAFASEHDRCSEIGKELGNFLDSYACIPCSPDGQKLKKCNELIHSSAKFAKLYDADEGMFPIEELVKRNLPEVAMKNLGIIHDKIPWDYVIARAQTVQTLMQVNRVKAYSRIGYIIEAISSHTEGEPPNSSLDSISFLPVLKKPEEFPLEWPGGGITLSCGKQMMVSGQTRIMSNVIIAGSRSMFVCDDTPQRNGCGPISTRTHKILSLRDTPSLDAVIEHFKLIIEQAKIASLDIEWMDKSCRHIYSHFEKELKNNPDCAATIMKLADLPCIWTGSKFISTSEVCFTWSMNGPYLYKVPSTLHTKKKLCAALEIKQEFSGSDIKNALTNMKEDYKDRPVDKKSQEILNHLIPAIQNAKCDDDCRDGNLLLPDEKFCLHRCKDLAYNDAPWMSKDETYNYINHIISRDLAMQLGVRPVRSKVLDKYSSVHGFSKGGVSFGQREDLTRRIQNILRDYPLDITLIKELLQNADDAKATKMYVILDERFHKSTSILSKEWEDLQGPAMLVWNDSVFSEKDLEGIQELGLGSKRSEADTIGQYGIGFNVAYHVTDCPSFISNDETLCIMDPHCRYTPEADMLSPGRRFDKLNELGFWHDFPDMQSAYLRKDVDDLPSEVLTGSLFRFPIRHSDRTIPTSEIVDGIESSKSVLDAAELGQNLEDWMGRMKEAMLFLNNVTELKLLTIKRGSRKVKTVYHFKTEISDSALTDQKSLHGALSAFKNVRNCKSCLITYPLTLTEVGKDSVKWLIQQGVGDKHNESCEWKYISSVKPRHGLAAPLSVMAKKGDFKGQVFCFLPLPVRSEFPIHVNAHFILNSTRRELWRCTELDGMDNRTRWNDNLIQALASSYADFLINARSHYVLKDYKSLRTAVDAVGHYYSLFPPFNPAQKSSWNTLAQEVYKLIIERNHPVFPVLEVRAEGNGCTVVWCPPRSSSPADHVYYWSPYNYTSGMHKEVYPILQRIGMKITPAPPAVMECFNATFGMLQATSRSCGGLQLGTQISSSFGLEDNTKLLPVTRVSLFKFYTQFSTFAANVMQPMSIEKTSFQDVQSYLTFTKYIVAEQQTAIFNLSQTSDEAKRQVYPESPFSHYLLLTADGMLRRFDEGGKLLMSRFSGLFSKSPSSFLHPTLLSVSFTEHYFIQPADRGSASLVLQIFDNNLPLQLKSVAVVEDAISVISRDKLLSLWTCFGNDGVFGAHISLILKTWALLLSQDNRLFSMASKILPVYDITVVSYQYARDMSNVMKKMNMPFLDTSVVVANANCPSLSDGDRILSNIYHTNIATPLLTLLHDQGDLNIIITYLAAIQLMPCKVKGRNEQVMSLPLFENIDGSYTSVCSTHAHVWPNEACTVAYQKWLEGHNAVFIRAGAKWSRLGNALDFSIRAIEVEELYVKYIFCHFGKMDESDRYQHLEYIRDCLHKNMKFYSQNVPDDKTSDIERQKYYRANSFLEALQRVQCIGSNGSLHRICEFCDHTVEIFNTFSDQFLFLPDDFKKEKEEKWLHFFQDLGLQQTVSDTVFLRFCQETANRRRDVKECSNVLLRYLKSSDHIWDHHILAQVSEIAFVLQEPLPNLSWLVPSVFPVRQMVKLKGSAPKSKAILLWTLKPIIDIPYFSDYIVKGLGIDRSPSSADVINNIQNISTKSQYAQQSLFTNYPSCLQTPDNAYDLLHIIAENLTYLNRPARVKENDDFSGLRSLPCVPVYHTTAQDASRNSMVLVKPCQVVMWENSEVRKFHPFLHCLPEDLHDVLRQIGVKGSLELCHMQVVLEGVYKQSEGEQLDMNTEECVKLCVKRLEGFLKNKQSDSEEVISPLYLPDSESKMKLSKSLLYGDTINYFKKIELDLKNVPHYFHFNIEVVDYKVKAISLCRLLPDSVRPIGLSTVCKQQMQDSSQRTKHSKVAQQLLETVHIPDIPAAIVLFLNMYIGNQENEDDLKELVKSFLGKIEVVTVNALKIQILLKEDNQVIGTLDTTFSFVPGVEKCTLYLDSSLDYPIDNDDVYLEVATHLCRILNKRVKGGFTAEQEKEIIRMMKQCLKAQNVSHLRKILSEFGVKINQMQRFRKRLGEEVPECWHHRLDQDIDNVFNPMEYVGYEIKEGHIIIAQVVHPVKSEGETHQLERKFRIYVKVNDPEGIDVSVLCLYKFLIGHKETKIQTSGNDEPVLIPFDGDDEIPRLRSSLIEKDLILVMKNLCEQLREIWKLPPELRRKAIKRLYLRWHPDKSDDPDRAEKIFKFLMKQIEHLEKGEPLDDPEADVKTHTTSSGFYSGFYSGSRRRHRYHYHGSNYRSRYYDFHNWSGRAYQQSSANDDEDDFFGYGGGGSGQGEREKPETSKYYPFDKEGIIEKSPEEGHRWVAQAEAEFKGLMAMHSQQDASSSYGYVCFMAHQVVEKALKGGVYALCGLDGRSLIDHNLSRHAHSLHTAVPVDTQGLVDHSIPLEDYYLKTRYPNKWSGYTDIPFDHYSAVDGDEAVKHAQAVLDMVKAIMPTKED